MQKLEKSALILCLYIVQTGLVFAAEQGIDEKVYQQTNGNSSSSWMTVLLPRQRI